MSGNYCRICGEPECATGEDICLFCGELRKEVMEGVLQIADLHGMERELALAAIE